jgi:hypothetical protein
MENIRNCATCSHKVVCYIYSEIIETVRNSVIVEISAMQQIEKGLAEKCSQYRKW